MLLSLFLIRCKKEENEDCHFYITIKNNSSENVIFSTGSYLNVNKCFINSFDSMDIPSNKKHKYQPYSYPDCIEKRLILDGGLIWTLYIIDPANFLPGYIPCEEFEKSNTILRYFSLTLEDLERMNYTINYPEDASIGVD